MALIKCPECDREISDKAEECPGCGCPTEQNSPTPSDNSNVDSIHLEHHSIEKPPAITIDDIPTGLYKATAILGFPLGLATIGFYSHQKKLIEAQSFEKAVKHIRMSTIACWMIIVPCSIAILILLFVVKMIFS